MKVTTFFLKSDLSQISSIFKKTFENILNIMYFFIFVISFTFITSKVKIDNNILVLATNIRKNDSYEVDLASIKNIYLVFNSDNYSFNR